MSHIVEIQTEIRDPVAVQSACSRLKLPAAVLGSHRMFSGSVVGLGVELPDWRYPVVCDLASGQLRYDSFGGRWGEQAQLDRFLQAYTVEKARIEVRRKGHTCTEQTLADGSIKLTVNVEGAA